MNQASFSKGYIDESKQRFTSKISQGANIRKGDLLMASTGGGVLGKVFYFDSDDESFYADSHVTIMRDSRGKNLMKYLYYAFSLKYDEINATLVKGSTNQTELQRNYLLAYEMEMPSTIEQKSIVDYLDEKTKAIDARISVLEKKSDAYIRLKASVINRAVTRGLNPNVPLKDSGIEWISMIPEHWEVKRVKDITSLYGRIGFRGYTTDDLVEEGKGAITLSPTNIIDGKIDYKKCSYLSWEKYYESPEIMVENGDIVLVKTASVGKCALVENLPLEATLNPQFVIFKQITCNSKFLIYILQSYVQNYMNVLKIGSVVPTISQAQIYNFKITLPPLSEQQSIASYLDTKCAEIDKAIDNIGKQIDALKRLKRSLINEVVTGKRKV